MHNLTTPCHMASAYVLLAINDIICLLQAVCKVHNCVFAVDQSIVISLCLHKKHTLIRSSIKTKSGKSFSKEFSKRHVQRAIAIYVNGSIILAAYIAKQFFRVIFIVVLFVMQIILFHNVNSGCSTRQINWLLFRGILTL